MALLMLMAAPAAQAEDAYRRAVLNYQAHHYSAALQDLEKLVSAYPNNAMVRYYRALAYQGTNQIMRAKQDFEWVATNCPDGKIKQLGAQGLQNLGSYRSQISGSSAINSTALASARTAFPPASGSSLAANPSSKVKKILEFTSATCPTCIKFAPVFAQTKSQYSDLDMQSLDVADASNASLVEQYKVTQYPTIVFLSSGGNVLFQRAGAPPNVGAFTSLINQYR